MTTSAPVRFMPTPPALRLTRKTSPRPDWNADTGQREGEALHRHAAGLRPVEQSTPTRTAGSLLVIFARSPPGTVVRSNVIAPGLKLTPSAASLVKGIELAFVQAETMAFLPPSGRCS